MLGPIIHPPLPPWNHILLLQVPNLLLRLPYLLEITRMLLLIDIIRVFVETELSTQPESQLETSLDDSHLLFQLLLIIIASIMVEQKGRIGLLWCFWLF